MLPAPRIVRCHQPTSTQHAACRRALAEQSHEPVLIIHTFRQRRRGAEIVLRPGRHPLSAAVRRALDAQFAVWEVAGWIGPGGVGLTHPTYCRWAPVPLSVLAFLADVLRLLGLPPLLAPTRETAS